MRKIKKSLLLDAISAAQNYLPKEFICFLGGEEKTKTVTEIVFIPARTSGDAASIEGLAMPFDEGIVGSLHSHPFSGSMPSRQDKRFFSKYRLNIIFGHPYAIENTGFYDQKGEKTRVILE